MTSLKGMHVLYRKRSMRQFAAIKHNITHPYRLKYRLKLSKNIKAEGWTCNKEVRFELAYTFSDQHTGSFRTNIKLSFLIKL